MTQVNLVYRRPDGTNAEGTLLTADDGVVQINSTHRYQTSDGEMTTVAFTAPLGATVSIDPGTWVFELAGVSNGKGGYLTGNDAKSIRTVPNTGGPYDIDDLTEVTPSGNGLAPDWKVYIDAAVAGITAGTPTGTGPGGQFVIADVYDSTTVGRLVVKAADAAAGRTAIGAAAAANAVFTGSVTIPDNALAIADTSGLQTALDAKAPLASPTFTGTVVVPAASGSTSPVRKSVTDAMQALIDALTAQLLASPWLVFPSGGSFAGRPVTERSVWWMSSTITPPFGGTTTSGTGMVDGLDVIGRGLV